MQIINNIVFLSFHNLKANILLEKKNMGSYFFTGKMINHQKIILVFWVLIVDSLSMYLTLIYRKRELTLAMQRVETIKKCDLREIVTLFCHVVNLQVSLCKYGFFVMFLICYHYLQWILEGVSKGGQWGVSVLSKPSQKRESLESRSSNALHNLWLLLVITCIYGGIRYL